MKGWIPGTQKVGTSRNLDAFDKELRPISGVPITDDVEDEVTA
ncbi:hypothetical protein [Burkholderia vietnamiensis]|nr:hypothetical protein [Burkholderia vietnamiensis]